MFPKAAALLAVLLMPILAGVPDPAEPFFTYCGICEHSIPEFDHQFYHESVLCGVWTGESAHEWIPGLCTENWGHENACRCADAPIPQPEVVSFLSAADPDLSAQEILTLVQSDPRLYLNLDRGVAQYLDCQRIQVVAQVPLSVETLGALRDLGRDAP